MRSETGEPNETLDTFLGGVADIILWRKKEISIAILSISSFVWICVELLDIHFTTLLFSFICLTFSIMYWNNIPVPKARLPEAPIIQLSLLLHSGTHRALTALHTIAVNKDMKHIKRHIMVVHGTEVIILSVLLLGSLTFIYVVILMLLIVPISFENYKKRAGEGGAPLVSKISKIRDVSSGETV